MAARAMLTMLRPTRHTLRPKRTEESTTDCMRCMLLANMAMMMRPSAFSNSVLNVWQTFFSDIV